VSPFSLIVIAFFVALPVMAFAFAGGAVIVALPVSMLAIATIGLLDFSRRRKRAGGVSRFREEAASDKVEFTERDRETLTPE
jgi:hypothetical protein